MNEALQSPVIEINMGQLNIRIFQGFHIYTEPMVLGSNLNLSR
jgi:hypothetical protein